MIGWSELIFGSMYCGKSEELIRRLKRVKIAGQKYQLFKPDQDDRYGLNKVATHENHEVSKKISDILIIPSLEKSEDLKETIYNSIMEELSGSLIAQPVKSPKELLQHVEADTEVVGIDEVQFFDEELIAVIDKLTKMGKRVICAGLDMYASGDPFGIVPTLACKSKYVDKLRAVCVDCGKDAYISYKVDNDEDNHHSRVDVGSEGKYIALCENCAHKRQRRKK